MKQRAGKRLLSFLLALAMAVGLFPGMGVPVLAEETGAFFADAADWGIDLAYDGIHFSEAGHRQFARQMENVLAQIEECLA